MLILFHSSFNLHHLSHLSGNRTAEHNILSLSAWSRTATSQVGSAGSGMVLSAGGVLI